MNEQRLIELVANTIDFAKQKGADAVSVSANTEHGFGLTVHGGDVETLEHHQENGLGLSVYFGQRSATVSTSDLSLSALNQLVDKACTMARQMAEDIYNGLPDRQYLAFNYPDLNLNFSWEITPSEAIQKAIQCEALAQQKDSRIKTVEEVSLSTYNVFQIHANSSGFLGHYWSSRHSMSCSVIAERNDDMQQDHEYTVSRDPKKLASIEWVAEKSVEKAVRRLGARKIKTQQCPVLFVPRLAKSLIGSFVSLISGKALYRRSSCLLDHLDQQIFPEFVDIYQEPHLLSALGSAPFDTEGVATQHQYYVEKGILRRYCLGSYSARRLGLTPTGNAGGVYNLTVKSSEKNFQDLLKTMNRGLIVTELMGRGINSVTGDYSRGAFGYWVENGEIQYPVEEITIAGNMKDMFRQIIAVGHDIDERSSIRTGSILIEKMMVAGC